MTPAVRAWWRRARWPHALALFAALTIVLAYPLSTRPASHVLEGGADTRLFLWTLGWNTHALTANPFAIFDANIFYPQRFTLAYSENLIGSTLIAAPVWWLSGNHVLALNAVQLTSAPLCALGAYVLARQLGLGFAASVLCGIVFGFSPPRFFRIGQVHLTTVQWLPFALAALHAYLDEGKAWFLRLAIALAVLQAFTSGHGFVFLLLASALLLLYRFALGEPLALRRRLRDIGLLGAALMVPVGLLFVPYLMVQQETGLRRSLVDWAPTPQSFIASPSHLHTALLSRIAGPGAMEDASAFLFPGYLPLIFTIVALAWRRRPANPQPPPAEHRPGRRAAIARWAAAHRRDPVLPYALITLVAVLLSAGPPIGLWPLVYWMPGLNFVRVPSRFTILAVLGLAVLTGFGVERLAAWVRSSWRTLLPAVIGLLLVVEFAAIPLTVHPFAVDIPAVDRWLNGREKPFAIAEFPTRRSERLQATYMVHSMAHWQKTVHGYSGHRAQLHWRLYRALRSFPDERSLSRLADLGVGYLVVHTDGYSPADWPAVEARLRSFDRWLTLEYSTETGRVYALKDPRAAASTGRRP